VTAYGGDRETPAASHQRLVPVCADPSTACTRDVITCDQLAGEKLAAPSRDVVLWLSGYYNGKRNNTIIQPLAIKKHADQINLYCLQNRDTTVMDAVKNVLDLDK
jgi:HdeA/HdeB family